MLFVVVISINGDLGDKKPNSKPIGTTNINSLVNQIKINNYFIKNNSYWTVCREHEDNIRDKKSGYEIERYERNPIVNIYSGRDYKHNITKKPDGGYEMEVSMTCTYNVRVQLNAFGYHEEEMEYSGGTVLFNMNIQEEEGYYRLLGMKAYRHIY